MNKDSSQDGVAKAEFNLHLNQLEKKTMKQFQEIEK